MIGKLRPLAALALVVSIAAGCGSNAPSKTGTAGSSGTASSAREKAVKFSECVRAHGVSAFPDPDASGQLTIDGVVNGSSLDPNSATFEQAISACKNLEPAGFTGHRRSDQEQEGALKLAQCIREHGVKDFPDPTKGAPLVDTNRIPSSATSGGMTILNAAMHTCSALAAKAGVSR